MKRLAFPLLLLLGFILACASANKTQNTFSNASSPTPIPAPSVKPVIDIPALAKKTPSEVDAILGKPQSVTPITNDADMTPGEYRDYKIVGTEEGASVRFYRGRAILFRVQLPQPTETPEAALLLVGINVDGAKPSVRAAMADRWKGSFNNIRFKDVAAFTVYSGSRYDIVQAEISD